VTFGELIAAVVEYVYGYWPFRIVSAWEQGIRLRSGRVTGLLQPGIHMFWPLVGEIITSSVALDVNATEIQTVETYDGYTVSFSLAMKYRITDLAMLYVSIQDHDETIGNEIASSAASQVAAEEYDSLAGKLGDLVWFDVHERLEAWGVELVSVDLLSFTQCRTFRLIGDSA
jgi:regulator of protease activity HflC (stomatin/prohibitin superfamily)